MIQRLLQIIAALTGDRLAHAGWERALPDHGRRKYKLGPKKHRPARKPRHVIDPAQRKLPLDNPPGSGAK